MNIPDEAIEAAARVEYSSFRRHMAELGIEHPASFDSLPRKTKKLFREWVRPNLVAAFPHIVGPASREAEDAKVREFWRATKPGSYCYDGPVRDEDRAGYIAARGFFAHDGDYS